MGIFKKFSNSIRQNLNAFLKSKLSLSTEGFFLLTLSLCFLMFGILFLYSASYIYAYETFGDGFYLVKKQGIIAIFSIILCFFVSFIDLRKFEKKVYLPLFLSFLFLIFVFFFGEKSGGAKRWIHLGIRFQPSEFVKILILFFVAAQVSLKMKSNSKNFLILLSIFLPLLPILFLLLKQPDYGSFFMLMVAVGLILFSAGMSKKVFAVFGVGFLGLAGILIALKPYRLERVLTYFDPWRDPSGSGFQILQSLAGLHQGALTGVGLGNSRAKLFFLPEAHNDFIFAVIGEELGFLGVFFISALFLIWTLVALKIVRNRFEWNKNKFENYLGIGLVCLIAIPAFINMSVAFSLLPNKGTTLPFISYGGSALVGHFVVTGLLLSLSRIGKQRVVVESKVQKMISLRRRKSAV